MATVLDLVRHYQHGIEKYSKDEARVLRAIEKLFKLDVKVQHLQETGIGRTVNALRKTPGDVGSAARSLVYKWKKMVSAEESDPEEPDSSMQNGHSSGKDSDDGGHQTQRHHRTGNGDHSGTKRKYHSCEEEPNTKKSKHRSSTDSDNYKKHRVQIKEEPSDSEESDSQSDSEDESSESSEEEQDRKPVKIKEEPEDSYTPTSKHSHSHTENSTKSSDSKKSHQSKEHHNSKQNSLDIKHSSEKSSKHSQSSKDNGASKDKEHSDKKHREHRADKEKSHREAERQSKSSSTHSSEKHRSTDKSESRSDKHKSQEKSSSSKHNKSSSETESTDKHRSKDRSSTNKDKTKDVSSSSKEKSSSSSSHDKSHKKHSSSRTDSTSASERSEDKTRSRSDKHNEKKSSHKSSSSDKNRSSSSSKSKEDIPKKKVSQNTDSDDGIGCESGASFAEALGMALPSKPKKKQSTTPIKDAISPDNDMSPMSLLSLGAVGRLAPLPALEISALPEISPHYKPRPPLPAVAARILSQQYDNDAMAMSISSKNQRTKVYSGNKIMGRIPSLYEMCVEILQEHIDALEYTGGVPYDILKPVIDKATPIQLYNLEHFNPYLMEDTDHLWKIHCEKHFRNKKRQEMETWREMYSRCEEEREHKLRSLTANIRMTQEAKKAPIKQTKMAYVDSVVKPPRNIARKQAQHGTAHSAAGSPAARVASLNTPNVLRPGARAAASPLTTSSLGKPKKAPLMAKALQIMRGRKR